MVFATRDRFKVDYVYSGSWTPDIRHIPPIEYRFPGSWSRCRDNPGFGRDQGFLVEKLTCEGGYISGDLHGNGFNIAEGECPTQRWPYVNAESIVAGIPSEPNPVMAAKVLASSNPSKPHVNMPVSIVELRELPLLVKTFGDNFFGTYLGYQFGVKPVVSDAINLFTFPVAVSRRMRELKRLQTKGFTCKKVQLDNQSYQNPPVFVGIDNKGENRFSCYGYETTSWTQKTWGYANWYLDEHDSPVGDDVLMQRALSSLRGTDNILSLSNLWELLPWTWALDYFGNVGDILSANNNTVGASNDGNACICITTVCRLDGYCSTHPQFVSPYRSTFTTKSRTQVPATLSASLPYLSGTQTAILASIGATRR